MPPSRIPDAGYMFDWEGENHIHLAAETPPSLEGAVISSIEAWNIDNKIDDGLADSGLVITYNGKDKTGCLTGTSYNLENEEVKCQMQFVIENN